MQRLFLILVAFGLTLGTVQATTVASPHSELETLLDEVQSAHESAQTYQEWSHSPYSPENLAELLLKRSRMPGFTKALCEALKNQPVENLYYLSEYFAKAPLSVCLAEQSWRYRDFLSSHTVKIQSQDPDQPKLGPSQEILLDNENTSLVIDGHLPEKTLVLTFDDGPHRSQTEQLLEILAAEDVQAQFFLVGENSRRYPHLIRLQDEYGHEVGCHADTHPDLRKMPFKQAQAEIEAGFSAIEKALSDARTFFRFPYGAFTHDLRNYLAETFTTEFYWNIDTLDWKIKNPTELLEYALKQIRKEGRGVVLMHDIQPQTIAMMPALLSALKEEGYKLAIFRPTRHRISPQEVRP